MVTYDEFMKKNKKVKNLEELYLGVEIEESALEYKNERRASIVDNPSEYFDIARNAHGLKRVVIDTGIHEKEWYEGVKEFVKNCDENTTIDNCSVGSCTKEEFLKGEEIIESVVAEIDPSWNVKQKTAFVHCKMGKLVTYMADYCSKNTPENSEYIGDRRNIWRALTSGITVCNGVCFIEQAILSRVGVETEILDSKRHSYLLAKSEEGNILSDATWDLSFTAFDCKPQYFGKTYEEFRKIDGPFCESHKLSEVPENIIEISDEERRDIYQSVGIIGEDKLFHSKVQEIIKEIKTRQFSSNVERTEQVWQLIENKLNDKFSHIEECKSMFERCLAWCGIPEKLEEVNGEKENNIISEYVYKKEDTKFENPMLSVFVKSENITKIISSEGKEVRGISLQELKNGYMYHENNRQETFWDREINGKSSNENVYELENEWEEKS